MVNRYMKELWKERQVKRYGIKIERIKRRERYTDTVTPNRHETDRESLRDGLRGWHWGRDREIKISKTNIYGRCLPKLIICPF